MADLENLLLQAAGRTGGGSGGRKSSQSRPPPPQSRWRRDGGSYSNGGSDSKSSDESEDDRNFSSSAARKAQTPVPVKKRIDPPPGKDGWSDDDDDEDLPRAGGAAADDDSDSAPSIGSDLYKDDEDKENLGKMSELDREMILAERSTMIDDYRLKKKARETTSKTEVRSSCRVPSPSPPSIRGGRSSLRSDKTTTAAKSDALNELRAKRMKQQNPDGHRKMRDGAAGGKDSTPVKHRLPIPAPYSDSSESEADSRDDKSADDNERMGSLDNSGSKLEMLKYEDIKAITIRRSKLAKWFMEPFFEELIVGCFVRVGIGKTKSGKSIYRLCMVKNVDATDTARHYKLENRTTYKWLNCIWGNEASAARWQMAMVSDSSPLEEEYNDWIREVEQSGGRMLGLKEVNEKKEEIQKKINSYVYSAATVKQMLQEKKSASMRPLNIAAEKDRLRKEMEVAKSRRDEAEMERIQNRFKELEEISSKSKQKDSKAVRLAEMNRKNRAENFKNASEMKPVNTSLKAGEAGYDPFSRRWTRSTNYYVSKAGGENGAEVNANGGDNVAAAVASWDGNAVGSEAGMEAGLAATAAALEAAAGAGKLVDTSPPVDQGTESNTLHNFELPITLAGLLKFGGPHGVQDGFMARKQRIEGTIGCKVPDNDGRRHALTLTVSDYKRRRGLL